MIERPEALVKDGILLLSGACQFNSDFGEGGFGNKLVTAQVNILSADYADFTD